MKWIIQFEFALLLGAMGVCLGQTRTSAADQRQTAFALEQQGRNPEAEAAWRAYSKTHPSNPEPYAHLGLLEARQEHYKAAAALYRKALAMKSTIPNLRLNLGLALFKGDELKDAATEFSALLKTLPPDSPEAQRVTILLGMAYYGQAEYAQAVPFLKQAALRDTQNLPLRLALAHSCLWSKQYPCVLDVYHEMLVLNAESAEVDMLAGEASDEMLDRGGAIEQFRAAVNANPKEPNVHFGLGYLLWKQHQLPEAATELQAELANDPVHPQATLYLGDTLLQLNKPEEARPLLEKAVRLDPSLWLGHLDLGIIDSDADRKDDALREMQMAVRLKPDEVNVHWRLGKLYRAMGRKEEAKAEFDTANSINKTTDEGIVKKMSGAVPGSASAPPANP